MGKKEYIGLTGDAPGFASIHSWNFRYQEMLLEG